MMWAKTARIGCGLTAYRSGRFNARLYVCNYGESGNVISLPVYRIGGACEDCRGSCSRDYPALCSAPGAPAAGHNVGSADPSLSAAHSNSNNTPVNFGQPQQPSQRPSSQAPSSSAARGTPSTWRATSATSATTTGGAAPCPSTRPSPPTSPGTSATARATRAAPTRRARRSRTCSTLGCSRPGGRRTCRAGSGSSCGGTRGCSRCWGRRSLGSR